MSEWFQIVKESGFLGIALFVLWRMDGAVRSLTRIMYRVEAKLDLEHDTDRRKKEE